MEVSSVFLLAQFSVILISVYSKLAEIAVVPLKKIKRLERNRESARFLLDFMAMEAHRQLH
jgi:hypothetical protein